MNEGFNRLIILMSVIFFIFCFLLNFDLILNWDRSGGIIPVPAFCILSLSSFAASLGVYVLLQIVKKCFEWVAEGFRS